MTTVDEQKSRKTTIEELKERYASYFADDKEMTDEESEAHIAYIENLFSDWEAGPLSLFAADVVMAISDKDQMNWMMTISELSKAMIRYLMGNAELRHGPKSSRH